MNVFPFTPRREFMKTQQLPVILKSHVEITVLSWYHSFWKAPFSKCFPSTLKRKVGGGGGRFQIPPVWRAFSCRFRDGRSVDGRRHDTLLRRNVNEARYFCWELPCAKQILRVLIFGLFHHLTSSKTKYSRNVLVSDDEECWFVQITGTPQKALR